MEEKTKQNKQINTELISLHEASKKTGYAQSHLNLLCRQGELEGQKIGRNWFVTREKIVAFLALHKNGAGKEKAAGDFEDRQIENMPASGIGRSLSHPVLAVSFVFVLIFFSVLFPSKNSPLPKTFSWENIFSYGKERLADFVSSGINDLGLIYRGENQPRVLGGMSENDSAENNQTGTGGEKNYSGNNNSSQNNPAPVTSEGIAWHAIEAKNIDGSSITSRTIKNKTILSEDLASHLTIQRLVVDKKLIADNAEMGTIDLGTNTISDGTFTGNWNFGSGNLATTGNITASTFTGALTGSFAPSGDVDMTNNILTNIGNAGTDFNNLGGLTLANALTVTAGGISVTGNSQVTGNLTVNSGNLILGSNTITTSNTNLISNLNSDMTDGYHLNQNVLSSSTPTFAGLTLNGNLVLGSNTLTTSNTTLVSNLNADLLDGQHGSYYAPLANINGTINELAYFDTTSTVASLAVATYPSLTELSYVKGVTSGIQGQLNAKGTFTLPALTSGSVLFSNGSTISQDNDNLFWDNTNKRLGIGTASPGYLLDIYGGIASGLTTTLRLKAGATDTVSGPAILFQSGYAGEEWYAGKIGTISYGLGTNYRQDMVFYTHDTPGSATTLTERFRITGIGNVGIGTTAPASLLDVAGTSWLRGVAGGTSGLYVNSSGNVGIGTTNPTSLFSVGATSQFQINASGIITAGSWNGTAIVAQYGGTGINGSSAGNGTLLIGNGTGYTLANITAGTGISITNASGAITVNTIQDIATASSPTFAGLIVAGQLTSNIVSGTAPFVVASNTMVANLNSDYLDGQHGNYYAPLANISGTTNEIAYFNSPTTIASLTTATYPSLTELSYVKGVTSGIQSQLNAKFTLPALTSGSVLFSNGSTISQDNANFFWDNTNKRLGIGTTSPGAALDIGTGRMTGGTNSATYRNYLNMSGQNGFAAADTVFPGGDSDISNSGAGKGVFRSAQVSVGGANDIFFQAVPLTSAGYGYFETAYGAGTAIGTLGVQPILFRPNRTTLMQMSATGGLSLGSTYVATDPGAGNMIIQGNVGIGTDSPTNILSLGGNSARTFWMERHTTADTAGNSLTVQSGGATSGATNKAGGDLILSSATATGTGTSNIYLKTATAGSSGTSDNSPSTKLTILGNGNVGIGTTDPLSRLSIVGSDSTSSNSSLNIMNSGNSPMLFVRNDGNVGIGTTNPGTKLTVYNTVKTDDLLELYNATAFSDWKFAGNDSGSNYKLTLRQGGSSATYVTSFQGNGGIAVGNTYYGYDAPANGLIVQGNVGIGYASPGTSSLAVSGNVGIGTTDPHQKLEVNGSIRMGALVAGGGSAVAVYRDINGDLADATSSIKYKTDISSMENVLPQIMQLRPVRFQWNSKTSTPGMEDFGMIAEEVNSVLPDLVTYNSDGTPRGLKYEKMGVFALKGLQEQQAQVSSIMYNVSSINSDIVKLNDKGISVDDKINIIGQSLNDLSNQNANLKMENDNAKLKMDGMQKTMAVLADQMKTLQDMNQSVIDFAKIFDPKTMVYKDSLGNITLADGKITAKDIEVLGTMKAKDVEAENSLSGDNLKLGTNTKGEATIISGEKETIIKTPQASKNSQIYLTPKGGFEKIYYDENDTLEGESFKVKIDESADHDVRFNWLIVK